MRCIECSLVDVAASRPNIQYCHSSFAVTAAFHSSTFLRFGVSKTVSVVAAQNKSSAVADRDGPFGHNRHGPKSGGGAIVPLSVGELGPHLRQCRLGRGYLRTK